MSDLTPSAFVVGLLVPLQYGIALLAQPWIAQWLSGRARRVPLYRNQALVRAGLWSALAAAVWTFGAEHRGLVLMIFFVIVTADAFAAGLGNIAFSDVLARVMPKTLRGRARGGRGMACAIVGGTAGALIAVWVSPESGLGIFALLFAIAGACYALGGFTFAFISEPAASAVNAPGAAKNLKSRVREMLAQSAYRRFLAIQILLVPATQSLAFFTLFGRREFHLDLKALGLLILSDAVAPLLGKFLWGRWADRLGNRWVLRSAATVSFIAPVLAIVLAFSGNDWSNTAVLTAFAAIVFSVGVASAGIDLASKNFVLDLSPGSDRPVYIGVNDTLVALPTVLLVAGGAVIDWLVFRPVFFACATCSLIAAVLNIPAGNSARR